MVKSYICFLLSLHVVCGVVRRQVVLPGGGPIGSQLGGHCDIICNEETHSGMALCASDGKLYTTQCDYSNAQCKARQNGDTLGIVSYGACITMDTDCDVALHTRCMHSGINLLSGNSDGPEQVCGSNNRTYASTCEFRVAQCQQQAQSPETPLMLIHTGKCVVDTSNSLMVDCSKYTIDNSGLAIEGGSTGLLVSQSCPRVYKPICSTDGRTFSNECSLCHYKVNCSMYTVDSSGLAVEGGTNTYPHARGCPKIYKPICSTDARTFANECSYCSFLLATHSLPADNLVTYAAHEGRCTSVDIFG